MTFEANQPSTDMVAVARRAVQQAVASGAEGLSDERAFWGQVEWMFGAANADRLRDLGALAVLVECRARMKFASRRSFSELMALRTLEHAAELRAKD